MYSIYLKVSHIQGQTIIFLYSIFMIKFFCVNKFLIHHIFRIVWKLYALIMYSYSFSYKIFKNALFISFSIFFFFFETYIETYIYVYNRND